MFIEVCHVAATMDHYAHKATTTEISTVSPSAVLDLKLVKNEKAVSVQRYLITISKKVYSNGRRW